MSAVSENLPNRLGSGLSARPDGGLSEKPGGSSPARSSDTLPNKPDGALRVQDLSFAYPQAAQLLNTITFEMTPGARVLLCGDSGSGKSTLLRCLKPQLTPEGTLAGSITLGKTPVAALKPEESAAALGFLLQDPTQQLVMDTPRAELAFGLENLGLSTAVITRRVAEIALYFGMAEWLDIPVGQLSGGQRQRVNLAALVAMKPRYLLLDEPSAQLDPLARQAFFDVLWRVNRELGIGLLLIEHQLEGVYEQLDSVLYLRNGALAYNGLRQHFASALATMEDPYLAALPYAQRAQYLPHSAFVVTKKPNAQQGIELMRARKLYFRYQKKNAYLLRNLSCTVRAGQILGIVGANASGKTTVLRLLSGVLSPQHGTLWRASGVRVAALPQDPTALFSHTTVQAELAADESYFGYTPEDTQSMLETMQLAPLGGHSPSDLSGGEQQRLALAKLLLTGSQVLLLDEPSTALDYAALDTLVAHLKVAAGAGRAVVVVSHNLDFIARVATDVALLFDGELMVQAPAAEFFADNLFYTTAEERFWQQQGNAAYTDGCVALTAKATVLAEEA